MRIEIFLDDSDKGTPMEVANALINSHMNNIDYDDLKQHQAQKDKLAQIAEHIQTYLKYN